MAGGDRYNQWYIQNTPITTAASYTVPYGVTFYPQPQPEPSTGHIADYGQTGDEDVLDWLRRRVTEVTDLCPA